MMKFVPQLHKNISRFLAGVMLAAALPAVSVATEQVPSPQSATPAAVVTVATAPESELAVAPISCLLTTGEARIDYLLNMDCGNLTISPQQVWPELSVIESVTTAEVFATTLPAAPTVRWVNKGLALAVTSLATLPSTIYTNFFAALASAFVISAVALALGQTRQSKTLSELQVQRC